LPAHTKERSRSGSQTGVVCACWYSGKPSFDSATRESSADDCVPCLGACFERMANGGGIAIAGGNGKLIRNRKVQPGRLTASRRGHMACPGRTREGAGFVPKGDKAVSVWRHRHASAEEVGGVGSAVRIRALVWSGSESSPHSNKSIKASRVVLKVNIPPLSRHVKHQRPARECFINRESVTAVEASRSKGRERRIFHRG
jgi:hypothetical protein